MFIFLAVLGIITAIAVLPIDTSSLASNPHPIAGYEAAVSRYDAMQERERDIVRRDGGSLLYVHGLRTPRSIVLFHGLTNSPRQFRELAELFHERGYNVLVPRLPLHGLRSGDVAELGSIRAEHFREYADDAVDVAAAIGDTVFVIGLSAGGNVAAWIAHHRPDVSRILVISPALSLGKTPRMLDAPLMNVLDRVPNITLRQSRDTLRPHAYFGVSTRALGETLRFATTVTEDAERAPPVVREVTVVANMNDHTIDPGSALRLADLWRAKDSVGKAVYRFDARLGLPHDVIDVTQRCGMPATVNAVLVALIERRVPDEAREEGRCAARSR